MDATKEILNINNSIEINYSNKILLEHRKKFAQFFTPNTLAKIMSYWLLKNKKLNKVLEPAFGLGIFSRYLLSSKPELEINGFEIDNKIYSEANSLFSIYDNVNINLKDYMYNDWENKYDGIICNPPYFKFHDYDNKNIIKTIENKLHIKLNGFTNLYTLFLLKSIYQLKDNGRLAYIVPSEFLNSDYGSFVKSFLIKSKILRNIIVVDFDENVFENALTTACIILGAKDEFYSKVEFTTIKKIDVISSIESYIDSYPNSQITANSYLQNDIKPDVKWRVYYSKQNSLEYKNLVPFSNFAKVMRGIATGDNEYFTFSKLKAENYGINDSSLLPCICKSADVKTNFFTTNNFKNLIENNKLIYLFKGQATNNGSIRKYIELGERLGVNKRYLTSKRNPWYSLEQRQPAPIWVLVFNRNGLKFIRNEANISNLTTFHCIYPVKSGLFNIINIDLLFAYLLTDIAKKIFEDNRREYGNGLQKFEPNDINKSLMLDLSILGQETQNEILQSYSKYRKSVLQSTPNQKYLTFINDVFQNIYSR